MPTAWNQKSLSFPLIIGSALLSGLLITLQAWDRDDGASMKLGESSLLLPPPISRDEEPDLAAPASVELKTPPRVPPHPSVVNHDSKLLAMAQNSLAEPSDVPKAQRYLEQALSLNPGNKLAMEYYLRSLEGKDSLERALTFLEDLQTSSSDVNLSLDIGTILLNLERPAEALAMLESGLGGEAELSYEHLDFLAQSYLSNGRTEEAIRAYESIVKGPYSPRDINFSRLQLAKILLDSGRQAEGLEELRAMKDMDAYRDICAELIAQQSEL